MSFFAGLVYIVIGVLLTAACVIFLGGLMRYFFHLGNFHRDHDLEQMHVGVVLLVVVLMLSAIAHLIQSMMA